MNMMFGRPVVIDHMGTRPQVLHAMPDPDLHPAVPPPAQAMGKGKGKGKKGQGKGSGKDQAAGQARRRRRGNNGWIPWWERVAAVHAARRAARDERIHAEPEPPVAARNQHHPRRHSRRGGTGST